MQIIGSAVHLGCLIDVCKRVTVVQIHTVCYAPVHVREHRFNHILVAKHLIVRIDTVRMLIEKAVASA